ncbi:Mif2/CENP-C like-domain-containing protein [Kockiozyma suomiensis]|uniref:Mif2/CENP-C like-domain-containing protein n=1 Tax=Kockiozyma suomiensis TaxID=1337062 RepID=UPI003343EDF8
MSTSAFSSFIRRIRSGNVLSQLETPPYSSPSPGRFCGSPTSPTPVGGGAAPLAPGFFASVDAVKYPEDDKLDNVYDVVDLSGDSSKPAEFGNEERDDSELEYVDADGVFAAFVNGISSGSGYSDSERIEQTEDLSIGLSQSDLNSLTDDDSASTMSSPASSLVSSPGSCQTTYRKRKYSNEFFCDPSLNQEFQKKETSTQRRSSRTRLKPLEYWKNERIVYNLVRDDKSGGAAVPTIKSIVRADSITGVSTDVSPLKKKKQRATPERSLGVDIGRRKLLNAASDSHFRFKSDHKFSDNRVKQSPSFGASSDSSTAIIAQRMDNEFDYFVAETEDLATNQRLPRRVAVPSTMLPYISIQNPSAQFEFMKTFEEERGFLASGILRLPAGNGRKGKKKTGLNSLIFCVLEGTVEVCINDEMSFKIQRGGHFLVPRANSYSMRNAGRKMCIIFFAQATDTFYNIVTRGNMEVKSTSD